MTDEEYFLLSREVAKARRDWQEAETTIKAANDAANQTWGKYCAAMDELRPHALERGFDWHMQKIREKVNS